jgi:hypothetical protein
MSVYCCVPQAPTCVRARWSRPTDASEWRAVGCLRVRTHDARARSGAGFGAGSTADQVGTYPVTNVPNANVCASYCANQVPYACPPSEFSLTTPLYQAGCLQWVYQISSLACFMMNTVYLVRSGVRDAGREGAWLTRRARRHRTASPTRTTRPAAALAQSPPPSAACGLRACATPPQRQRTQGLSRVCALSGGGFGAGGSSDHVLPYPAAASSVEACRDLCENEPTCRQFVFGVRRCRRRCNWLVLNGWGASVPELVLPHEHGVQRR